MVDRYQEAALETRLGHPAAVRRRLGARPRQPARAPPSSRTTSAWAPPATRTWSRRSGTSRRSRPGPAARSGPSRRASAWPATTAGAAPTRASARTPKLVKSMETRDRRPPGHGAASSADADRVLATAKHFAGDGLTTVQYGPRAAAAYTVDQGVDEVIAGGVRAARARAVRARDQEAPRRLGHAVVLERRLDRRRLGNPIKMHANQELITDWLKAASASTGSSSPTGGRSGSSRAPTPTRCAPR